MADHDTHTNKDPDGKYRAWCRTPGCKWVSDPYDDAGPAKGDGERHEKGL